MQAGQGNPIGERVLRLSKRVRDPSDPTVRSLTKTLSYQP